MPVGEFFAPNQLPRLGQGFRGRLPNQGGGGLAPPPGIPHIHPVQRPPQINFGAVAQARSRPLIAPPAPGLQAAPGFGAALPQIPKMPKLSGVEKRAMNFIKNPSGFQDARPAVRNLLASPSQKMQVHLDNNPLLKHQHQLIQRSMGIDPNAPQVLPATPQQEARIREIDRQKKLGTGQFKPLTEGLPTPSFGNPLLSWGQRLTTGIAQDVTGAGPGLVTVGEHIAKDIRHPMYHDPIWGQMAKSTVNSLLDTGRHPIRMFWDKPDQGLMNLLTVASLGAGAVGRGLKAADAMAAVKSGEMSIPDAVKAVARTPRFDRSIRVGTGSNKHFDAAGIDAHGYHKSDFQSHPEEAGLFDRVPIGINFAKPGESIVLPRAGEHGMLAHHPIPRGQQASAIIDKETGKVGQVNLPSNIEGVRPGKAAALKKQLANLVDEKIAEANRSPIRITPPAFKSSLGGLLHTKVVDPLTERAIEARPTGTTQVFNRTLRVPGRVSGIAERHFGKLMRRDVAMKTEIGRGVAEQRILKQLEAQGKITRVEVGNLHDAYTKPTAEDMAADPWKNNQAGLYNHETGEHVVGHIGSGHDDLIESEPLAGRGGDPSGNQYFNDPWHPYTAIRDENGDIASVNLHGTVETTPDGRVIVHDEKNPALEAKLKGEIDRVYSGETKMTRAEAQRKAYAEGSAMSHADLWHSLYNGGAGSVESFEHNPNAYVGIHKPPDKWTEADVKKYTSERNIARQYSRMVETNVDKLKADPEAYTYIPKEMWKRLKLEEPALGHAAKGLHYIDAGNQLIRSGRFLHPGYAAWAVQNGILHVSQAGGYVFRNVYQLRNEFERLTPEEKATFDNSVGAGHFGGGIARATAGGEESALKGFTKGAARFWHNIDDKVPRRLSLIHELNRAGYHNAEEWASLMKNNPLKFRSIAQKAQHQAIDYAEMSPAERATAQKLFTAYGWTRGASTYTARFPFEHPVQAAALNQISQRGNKDVSQFWSDQGGMVPSWLKGYLPVGHGPHPGLVPTGDINPGETLGQVLESLPALVKGPHDSLQEQLGPAAQALFEAATQRDRFGNQLKGGAQLSTPIKDALKRFTPFSYAGILGRSKQGGGTFLQGPRAALFSELGIPYSQLRDPKTSAALGTKDWEQSLSKPDEIQFRHQLFNQQLPQQLKLYESKTGQAFPANSIARIKGDAEAVERRDMFQYQYAASRGVHSFRSLPAIDRVKAGIQFMHDHGYWSAADAAQETNTLKQVAAQNDEPAMNDMASQIWGSLTIGQYVNQWNSMIKQISPHPLVAGRG